MTDALAPHPDGYSTVTPWIVSPDTAKLLDFIKAAFGGEELARLPGPDGKGIGHSEIRVGDAVIMAFDSPPEWPETPAFIRLYLPDVRKGFADALAAGATVVTKPTLLAFGDKVGRVRDPLGNIWWLQQRVEDVDAAESERRFSDPEWVKPMAYLQDSLRTALHR